MEEIILFNNAGVTLPMGMTSSNKTAAIMANINVNYVSPILLITEFTRAFQTHDCPKVIVNITSGAAESPMHGASLYSGAKAGIEQFLRVVALEKKEQAHPINVLNLVPGMIDTGMQADVRAASVEDFPLVEVFRGFVDAGALRSPEVVANTIARIINENPQTGSRPHVNDYLKE